MPPLPGCWISRSWTVLVALLFVLPARRVLPRQVSPSGGPEKCLIATRVHATLCLRLTPDRIVVIPLTPLHLVFL